jgi:hypothetical protein
MKLTESKKQSAHAVKSNEVITSILGRCLIEPDFLTLAIEHPEQALSEYNLQPSVYEELLAFNFEKVHKFAGFITKVKNNNTWQSFLYTRMALRNFNMEAALFNYYFPEFMAYKSGRNVKYKDRLDHFYNFTKNFLNKRQDRASALCLSLITHEQTIRKIKENIKSSRREVEEINSTNNTITASSIPHLNSYVFINNYKFNPFDLIALIDAKETLETPASGNFWLLYRYYNQKLHISIQESSIGEILSLVNGKNSIRKIMHLMIQQANEQISLAEFLLFFENLFVQKIIYLE